MNSSLIELGADLLSMPYGLEPTSYKRLMALCDAAKVHGAGLQIAAPTKARGPEVAPAYAVIQVAGYIEHRPGILSMLGIGTACTEVSRQLAGALDDSRVSRVVMLFDTPGGSVHGVPELADEIRAARARKPVIAAVDGQCGSAGYWLASQASKIYASQSSEVGSIGVYQAHLDESQALDKAGLKVTLISAGKFKTELASVHPLSTEAAKHLQSRVDSYYGDFVRAVATGRNVSETAVRSGMGQGRMVGTAEAVAERMIDARATLREVLTGAIGPGAGAKAELADVHRWRHQELARLASSNDPDRRLAIERARRQIQIIEAGG